MALQNLTLDEIKTAIEAMSPEQRAQRALLAAPKILTTFAIKKIDVLKEDHVDDGPGRIMPISLKRLGQQTRLGDKYDEEDFVKDFPVSHPAGTPVFYFFE